MWFDREHEISPMGVLCTLLMVVALFLMATDSVGAEENVTHTFVVMQCLPHGYCVPLTNARVTVTVRDPFQEWQGMTRNGVWKVKLPVGTSYTAHVIPPNGPMMGCWLMTGSTDTWIGEVIEDAHHMTLYRGPCNIKLLPES